MTRRWANIGFSAAIIVACIVFARIAIGFQNPSVLAGAQVPTQAFPLMILAFTALCSLINIVNYLRGDPEGDADRRFDFDRTIALRVGSIVALLVGARFVWDWYGFIPASLLLCLGIAAVMQVRNVLVYVGLAAFGPMVWALFNYAIGVNL